MIYLTALGGVLAAEDGGLSIFKCHSSGLPSCTY